MALVSTMTGVSVPGARSILPERRKKPTSATTSFVMILACCSLVFLYLPLIVLMVFSFNTNDLTVFPLTGFTFSWYEKAFQNAFMMEALFNSIVVAFAAVIIANAVGIPTAFALMRWDFPGKVALQRIVLMPISLPALTLGICLLNYFTFWGVSLGLHTIMIGHGTLMSSIVVANLFARLTYFDRRIEEASADLGATPLETFWYVTLPNIRTTLIGSCMIILIVSFDELALTYFINGNTNTLPMYIWSMMRQGITPEINAIGSCVIFASMLIVGVSIYILSRKPEIR
ncbi:MAG: ABC transporter permease [bacterium]|nr:ABC transporter permease [bacterium]